MKKKTTRSEAEPMTNWFSSFFLWELKKAILLRTCNCHFFSVCKLKQRLNVSPEDPRREKQTISEGKFQGEPKEF